jgi:excisionase family DNA binding protein
MIEPIAVAPKAAFAAIGVGNTKGYELINSGELEAVKIGRSTRITWDSVKRLVETAPRIVEAA